ncbi:MAG: 2Fe-2S iron-sulfur cluster binding domain-containing protein [Fibrobacterota bacterium]|nr:2Fe-2S iron-sulfur cluster binding domain-containing protein [Fibrobacterota bacterium]QQS04594.1 MAG: 2Fe-2S iron-sulfur cluster binding domain-containing protein [Fibrobacterota bacterium]
MRTGIEAWIRRWWAKVRPSRVCVVDGRQVRFQGRTLHDAMTENGIDPGGRCLSGRCGRCRVRCVQGGYRLLAPAGWLGGGELLACQVSPGRSLSIERIGYPRAH